MVGKMNNFDRKLKRHFVAKLNENAIICAHYRDITATLKANYTDKER